MAAARRVGHRHLLVHSCGGTSSPTQPAREWTWRKDGDPARKEVPLAREEVDWILDVEGGNTNLIRRRGNRFQIRTGRCVTLAEMLYLGVAVRSTAYDVYKAHLNMPIFLHRQSRARQASWKARPLREDRAPRVSDGGRPSKAARTR